MRTKLTSKDVESINKFGTTLYNLRLCIVAVWPSIQFVPTDYDYMATTLEGKYINWNKEEARKVDEAVAHHYKFDKADE